uniref:Uncharacterized protein n=1 Tax=Arundo donax TaxID=35708 RepID=A0A0A8ZU84_ARUDO
MPDLSFRKNNTPRIHTHSILVV